MVKYTVCFKPPVPKLLSVIGQFRGSRKNKLDTSLHEEFNGNSFDFQTVPKLGVTTLNFRNLNGNSDHVWISLESNF